MKRFILYINLSLIFLFKGTTSFATVIPIQLDNRIESSGQIILAKVISSSSYWTENNQNIYTSYTMEAIAYLKKASVEYTFQLILPGGEVDGEMEVVSPNVQMKIGREYLVMVENAPKNIQNPKNSNTVSRSNIFKPYAFIQGVLPYINEKYSDFSTGSAIDEQTLIKKIMKVTKKNPVTPKGEIFKPRIKIVDKYNESQNPIFNNQNRRRAIIIKNSAGTINPTFISGTIETDNELVIEGSGFGSTVGTIQFQNSDSGGGSLIEIDQATDITSWTDTKIQVKIPSKAGTGNIFIKNSTGAIIETGSITIDYAINSLHSSFRSFPEKTRQNIKFTNRNEAGGFTIQLNNTSGFAGSSAISPLERAVNTWICETGINWQLDKNGTTTGFSNDGFCVASYEPNLPIGVLAITTSRYKASGNSSCSEYNTVWYLKEFDIQFMPDGSLGSYSWNYTESSPQTNQYDFETIALHELGHAHGLGHVINSDELMHFSISSGSEIRSITPLTHEGSQYKIGIATQPNCVSSHEPMTLLSPDCTPTELPSTSARVRIMLEGFYDESNNNLKTNLLANNLIPNDHPFDVEPYNYSQALSISNFPSNVVDWLLFELRDENDMNVVVAQKPVLIDSDGTILDESGNSLITFENLDDKNYYIAIFHKSHLPVISNAPQPLNDNPSIFDFSISANTTMGVEQQKLIDSKYFMSSGDFDGNGIINSLDFNLWKQAGAAVNSYSPADADGNGIINSLDFNLWKTNSSKVSILQRSN